MCFCPFLSPRCKVCPLTFLTKSEMQIHSKSHTEAKPHKCPHCSKTFANASYLSQHLRIHLGIKPYHCSYCENSFRQLSHLQQHTRWAWRSCCPHSVNSLSVDVNFIHFKGLSLFLLAHFKDPLQLEWCFFGVFNWFLWNFLTMEDTYEENQA